MKSIQELIKYRCFDCGRELSKDELWVIPEIGYDVYFCYDCYVKRREEMINEEMPSL